MKYLLPIIMFFISDYALATTKNVYPYWAIYYSDQAKAEEFNDYDLLVLDSDHHPPLNPLSNRNKILLGYISLGEVEKERYFFQEVKEQEILLQENPYWHDSFFIDIRGKYWPKKVLEEIIPGILSKSFDGLFLDTLDNLGELERANPVKYKGMVQAGVNLVKAIRKHYPDIKIMMNRGYELLPYLTDIIDMELGESVYADYNFKDKKYQLVDNNLYQTQVNILQKAQKQNPDLAIYTLDYWHPEDKEEIAEIYSKQRQNGFIPYVATIDLDKIIKEPLIKANK